MGVARHIFQHALCLTEQGGNVLFAAGESCADVSALFRQRLRLIVYGRIIFVEEHLCLLEDRKCMEIAFVLCHCLAEIREQGGTDIT